MKRTIYFVVGILVLSGFSVLGMGGAGDRLKANLDISSTPGQGTKITLLVPK